MTALAVRSPATTTTNEAAASRPRVTEPVLSPALKPGILRPTPLGSHRRSIHRPAGALKEDPIHLLCHLLRRTLVLLMAYNR